MSRSPAIFACMLLTLIASSAARASVPAAALIEAARSALVARAAADGIAASFAPVGRIDDVAADAEGAARVEHWTGPWLRPRTAVPVQVWVGERKHATVQVWFAVTAPAQAAIYAQDFPAHALGSALVTRIDRVDLARSYGRALASAAAPSGQRLAHAVHAGQLVLAEDFEPAPDIQAQQMVQVTAAQGAVRLSTRGRALSDGRIGQIIRVLPEHAEQPVRARIVSSQGVTLED